MEVRFVKLSNGRACGWTALRPPRSRVPGPVMAAGGDLPHDLANFVIELALGIGNGFWGSVAQGATFKTLRRKRTPQGTAVIRRNAAELDNAERRVNEVYFAWRAGQPTPVDLEIEAMLTRWRQLAEGEELLVLWPTEPPSNARHSHGRR